METIFTAFYIKMCFSVLLTKKTLCPYWSGLVIGQVSLSMPLGSAAQWSIVLVCTSGGQGGAHQPVPATSLHSPAVVCGDQWSEAHTIHSPAPRCAPNSTYSRSIAQCVVWRCYLVASVHNILTCFRYSISTKWFWV